MHREKGKGRRREETEERRGGGEEERRREVESRDGPCGTPAGPEVFREEGVKRGGCRCSI